ncbi:MAG: TonB-dependent receptor domain-containing protein, partial [Gemmatimonadaceae bacterium]
MILFVSLVVPSLLLAQAGASVSGRAVDAAASRPIGFATVVVQSTESGDTLSGTLAGQDGRFRIRGLRPGRYTIHVRFLGFSPAESNVLVSELNPSYDLGDIRLVRAATLEQVRVTTGAIQAAGLDTKVYRMGEGASVSTGSMLDALKNLPGVTVDQEGKVLLRGSDRVAVLIDGRQSSLTGFGSQRGLDNVSAANIQAIEVIHNPSASFDAAGMAGIINIIYKQDQQLGLSGEVGLSLGMGAFTKQRPDLPSEIGSYATNEKVIPSLSLNHNTKRVRSFVQGEYLLQQRLPNNEFTTRFYDDGRVIQSQVPENRRQWHYIVRAGTDFVRSVSNTFSLSGIYDLETHIDRASVPFILAATGERQRRWFWREKESTGFANASANWKRAFATAGHELEMNLQYTRGWEDEAYSLNEESSVRVGTDRTHVYAVEHTVPLSIDYTRPLASGRVEVGGKLQRRWLPVTYDVVRGQQSVIYPGLGDRTDWEEDLVAFYGNLVRVKDRYTLEAGLRIENTQVEYRVPNENIYYPTGDSYGSFEVFPNVKLTLGLDDRHQLIAAYNRRIDRPGEPELRIFPKYDDPELLKVGNPYLRPQLTHVFELGVDRSWSGGSIRASGYHRDITDAFQRIFAADESNPNYDIVNRIYENVGQSKQTGVELVADHHVTQPWQLSASVNWFVNNIDALEMTLLFPTARSLSIPASRDDSWDFTINNRVQLPRAAELQLSHVYYSARNIPQGRERARSSLDFSASMPFMRDRAEFVFTFTDIFNDFGVRRDVLGDGFTAEYQNLLESQVATARV